eukprot:CAMPEP_0179037002 /NCGR_PEP_ID=MMETSP0796-20121207/13905_1 /TAXON_ID=73915 /ORGANISM="Pyrodinium bahamense, Strain pbaha01" /LENGTH=152 /DNA_ID=CAMNT_0020733299 /DNA_START=101 /DNA_END=559 /DNA_ORIENTATION=-
MGAQCCAEKNNKDGEVVEKRFDKTIGLPVKSEDHDLVESAEEVQDFENEELRLDSDELHQAKIGEEFTVTIPHRNGMKLGIDTCASKFYPAFNIIKVKPDGLISAWNEEHPDRVVREGDDLIEVNGVRGDKEKICEFLGKAQSLQIRIQRNS